MTEGPGADAGRIVVGVDGSQPSQQALRWGAHLAAVFRSEAHGQDQELPLQF